MAWTAEAEGRALQRMVALLLSFAGLAERAGAASFPVRFIVLAILRHAETIAWAFAAEAAGVSLVRRASRPPRCFAPMASVPVDDGHADAIRLAVSFRTLALIVAAWATRRRASAALLPAAHRALFLTYARPGLTGHGVAAWPAPDTS